MPDFQGKILSQECGRYCRFLYLKMLNSDNIIYIYFSSRANAQFTFEGKQKLQIIRFKIKNIKL